ncbi:MAG: hypothetical protein ACE5K4_01080 [Candidatus Hydrothermarchaeota archaeon]
MRRRARRRLAAFALLLALLVLIVFVAIPSTLARYQGSHTWVIPKCRSCHSAEATEAASADFAGSGTIPHWNASNINNTACMWCHSTEGMDAGSYDPSVSVHGHNVTYSDCARCHIKGDAAGYSNRVLWLNSSAHGPMVRNATGSMGWASDAKIALNQMSNTSRGCVTCHTQVPVGITWTNKMGFNITYNAQTDTVTWGSGYVANQSFSWTVTSKT